MRIPARFQFIRELGHGGMGVVYEVYDGERGMRVALKTMHRLEPDDIVRCKREFRSLSRFNHPNVIHLYELVAEGDELCFTMEVVDGRHIVSYVCRDAAFRRGPVTQRASSNWDALAADVMPDEMPGERLDSVSDFMAEDVPIPNLGQAATTIHVPTLVLDELDDLGEADEADETRETSDAAPGPGQAPDPSERVALADRVDLERMGATLGQLADALRALHTAGPL
jgi:hypothetical protein